MTSIAIDPTESLHLVALDRPQLEAAQTKMIAWAKARLDKVDVDADVESTSLDVAAKNGWLISPFERRLSVLAKQRTFYTKIVEALEAGYAIVPNFAMTVFAIRTKAKAPRGTEQKGFYNRFIQGAQLLPRGDGRYVDPRPRVESEQRTSKDSAGKDVINTFQLPVDEFDQVDFPLVLARPEIMTSAGKAMALKLFDEIGVASDSGLGRSRTGDPILLGRLINPRPARPSLTFFLGWYFDPSRL